MRRLIALFLVPNALVLMLALSIRAEPAAEAVSQQFEAARAAAPPVGALRGAMVMPMHAAAAAELGPFARVPDWHPPEWLGGAEADALAGLSVGGPRKGPSVRSRSVMVYDVDAEEVLFEKRADDRRPIASLTKVVSALTMFAAGGDLEREVCIGAEQYPTRNGARSRLSTGDCAQGRDLLGAALVASDNRAAYSLAAVAGLGIDDFVARMNEVSGELLMADSSFTEPSGLEDENLSTARDLARATIALASVPELAIAASAPWWDLARSQRSTRRLFSTNKLLGQGGLDFAAAKTGYTDTARYCFTAMVETASGRRIVMTFLGAEGKQTRWADARRVLDWVERS